MGTDGEDRRGPGVYVITCTATGEQYVGCTLRHIVDRWTNHRSLLRSGKHHAQRLQAAWDQHGPDAFEFHVLERCPGPQCAEREQHWMEALNPALNSTMRAGGGLLPTHLIDAELLRTNIYWTTELRDRLRRLAAQHRRTVNAEVVTALEQYSAQEERRKHRKEATNAPTP